MKRYLTGAAMLAAALLSASAVEAATVVDFDEFTHTLPAKLHQGAVVSNGFSFTSSNATNGLAFWGTVNNADPDGATLVNWQGNGITTVRRTDGALFSLASLDIADTYDAGAAAELLFTFFDGVQSSQEIITLDKLKGLQTFAFNRGKLEWFSYSQVGVVGMQIDNVVLGTPIASAVPEPATWAMMILGLGGVGAVMRRRPPVAAFA